MKEDRTMQTASVAAHKTADSLGLLRDWEKVFTLTATNCVSCGKELRDAVSVTQGIGPECSAKHYAIDKEITPDMVALAMGLLFRSKIDQRVKVAVRDLRDRPRDLCNVLIWWASVHLDNADIVLDCANIVTALGFESLGDRLRERNTNAIIVRDGDDFILRCKAVWCVIQNMKRVREAETVPREGRFKYGWRFPANRKDLIWAILGEGFGNEWVTLPSKTPTGPTQIVQVPVKSPYDVAQAIRMTYNPPGPVTHVVTTAGSSQNQNTIVRIVGNIVEVHTPNRNFQFIAELKLLPVRERRWDGVAMCWKVARHHESRVRSLVAHHFKGAI